MNAAGNALSFSCPHCKSTFRLNASLAGKRGLCPRCKLAIEVPRADDVALKQTAQPVAMADTVVDTKAVKATVRLAPQTAAPAPKPKPVPAPAPVDPRLAVLNSFQGAIVPVEPAPMYSLGVFLAACAMTFLVAAYIGIIFLVAFLTYAHAVDNVTLLNDMFKGPRNSAKSIWLIVYSVPIVAGIVVVLFLVKPLFAKSVSRDKPRSLRPQDEPYLFAFVERVCHAVNAPVPTRIDVDCQVNASAGFRRGIWSMLSDDLVLTLGLPLVANLNLQQFAGILAHEFGHFSQNAGLRISYFVRSTNFWFARCVYERDQWDERLQFISKSNSGWAFFAIVTSGCVSLARNVLWCLMMLGHLVSSFLLRQMEFNADKYKARLIGSQAFGSTLRQVQVTDVAASGAYADLSEFMREGRLGDNLPLLIQANVKQIPTETLKKILASIAEEKTDAFSTHPCTAERIAAAEAERAPGLFHRTEPATTLFANFSSLAKTCTFDFYRELFGTSFKLTDMHPVDALLARQSAESVTYKSLYQYFQGTFDTLRPIWLSSVWLESPPAPKETLALVKRLRDEIMQAATRVKSFSERYRAEDSLLFEADQAQALLHAKIKFKPAEFHLRAASYEGVRNAREQISYRMAQLTKPIEVIADHNGRRLYAALQLMCVAQVAAKLPEVKTWQQEVNDLLHVTQLVGRQISCLVGLRNSYAGLSAMLCHWETHKENVPFVEAVISSMKRTYELIAQVREPLTRATYPFDHAHGQITLATFVLPEMPHPEDLSGVCYSAERVLDRTPALYAKTCAKLAHIAEQIEQAAGLPPLPEPLNPIEAPSAEKN